MVQQTSIDSYIEVKLELGYRQRQVLKALLYLKEANNREIAEFLGMPINSVTPRIHELRKCGRVGYSKLAIDPITQRSTIKWKLL
jgi:DNA-binding MarR family transcriptional regulator